MTLPKLNWMAYAEIATFTGLLMAVDFGLFGRWSGFVGVEPHPYWLLILAIGVRYGRTEGIVASGIAAVLYLLRFDGFKPGDYSSIDVFLVFKLPILFVFIGTLISEPKYRLDAQQTDYERQIAELKSRNQLIKAQDKDVQKSLHELEFRISGFWSNLVNLFHRIGQIRDLPENRIPNELVKVLVEDLGVTVCRYYELRSGHLVEKCRYPVSEMSEPYHDPSQDFILLEVMRQRQVAYVDVSRVEESQGHANSLIAGPLFSSEHALIGIISVEQMPFLQFNPYFFKIFQTLMMMGNSLLEERRQRESLEPLIYRKESFFYTHDYFLHRIEEGLVTADELALPLCLSRLSILDFDQLRPDQAQLIHGLIGTILAQSLGPHTLAAPWDQPFQIGILTLGKEAEWVELALSRAMMELDSFGFCPYQDPKKPLQIAQATLQINRTMWPEAVFTPKMCLRLFDQEELQ